MYLVPEVDTKNSINVDCKDSNVTFSDPFVYAPVRAAKCGSAVPSRLWAGSADCPAGGKDPLHRELKW